MLDTQIWRQEFTTGAKYLLPCNHYLFGLHSIHKVLDNTLLWKEEWLISVSLSWEAFDNAPVTQSTANILNNNANNTWRAQMLAKNYWCPILRSSGLLPFLYCTTATYLYTKIPLQRTSSLLLCRSAKNRWESLILCPSYRIKSRKIDGIKIKIYKKVQTIQGLKMVVA